MDRYSEGEVFNTPQRYISLTVTDEVLRGSLRVKIETKKVNALLLKLDRVVFHPRGEG